MILRSPSLWLSDRTLSIGGGESWPSALCALSRARSSRRDPIADLGHAATAGGEFIKKNKSRPGQTLDHDSPDRRQWILQKTTTAGPARRSATIHRTAANG